MYLLGIDTCGPIGSVAVGRLNGNAVKLSAQKELAGRTYSAALIPAVDGLLGGEGIRVSDIGCIVVVNGPGSFTGVRVGLGAAKGLAEGAGIPVVPVSRLQVLAEKAGTFSAALDAHRHEVFLRIDDSGATPQIREFLAGSEELALLDLASNIAVCDDPATALLQRVCPYAQLLRAAPPTAGDALLVAAPAVADCRFADVALLDAHYLRRSDAEIFGNTVTKP
jgi:tRNA threonylcarbamoyladenosine biosynthesis protein TsaB